MKTNPSVQPGSDGLVIMSDGTKYVCSVAHGGVSRIRAGKAAELIANNIPGAASMCHDAKSAGDSDESKQWSCIYITRLMNQSYQKRQYYGHLLSKNFIWNHLF